MLVRISSYQILMHICTAWCTSETIPLFSSKFKSASFGASSICCWSYTYAHSRENRQRNGIEKAETFLTSCWIWFNTARHPDVLGFQYNLPSWFVFFLKPGFPYFTPALCIWMPPPIYWYIDAHLTHQIQDSQKKQQLSRAVFSEYKLQANMRLMCTSKNCQR